MNNNYYQSPKSTRLMRMFWKAAGADQYLLERSTYSDQIKYFCLGGIVVATGVMAALAGGYAMYTIFEPKGDALDGMLTEKAVQAGKKAKDLIHFPTLFIACVFGLVWGLIIYNIDRFIVTSTGKGDGTEAITGQELRSALPRIIMGMIIALTISKPIEIRMFKSEIDERLSQKQQDLFIKRKERIDIIYKDQKDKLNKDIAKAQEETTNKYNVWRTSVNEVNKEMNGESGAGRYGPETALKMGQARTDSVEYYRVKQVNDTLIVKTQKKIDALDNEIEDEYRKAKEQVNALDGLLERLKLSHEIAGFWISLFITLLFMVIELTPIFFKMMLIKGPYDYMDENVKELARAESGIEIIYNYYEGAEGMEAHKVVNHGAELKRKERILILKAQDELNEQIISKWKENKKKDIDQNPDKYISEN